MEFLAHIYIYIIFLLESLAILFRLCFVLGIRREEKHTVEFNLVEAHVSFFRSLFDSQSCTDSVIHTPVT